MNKKPEKPEPHRGGVNHAQSSFSAPTGRYIDVRIYGVPKIENIAKAAAEHEALLREKVGTPLPADLEHNQAGGLHYRFSFRVENEAHYEALRAKLIAAGFRPSN